MATGREIRRLAFQALYQLDARGAEDAVTVRESLQRAEGYTDQAREEAFELAVSAFDAREEADREMQGLAPEWPTHRQAAVDRAILRLAHYEMVSGRTHPKVAVNEAVELAKEFSTERSPAFINALLDKVLKRVLAVEKQ
jgi:transcription antitermination protein NusB